MRNYFGWTSTCFAGGLFGGLVNSFFLWIAGVYGWTAALDVMLAPQWTLAWLYPRLVWGGLWGLLFLPRIMSNSFFWRGLLLSFAPTLVQLLIVFPEQLGNGLWGLDLGNLTPVVVVVANAVWGWAAALWVLLADDDRKMYGRRLR
ncbi:MAG: hypothetical protein AB9872_09840 [Solidesulfovibrio sp.]